MVAKNSRTRPCVGCGKTITRQPCVSWQKWCRQDRCSTCESEQILDRILSNVKITRNDCWEFQGRAGLPGGWHKTLCVHGWPHYVHVLSFTLHGGKIRRGHEVCHRCDNPPCVNPKHLFAATHLENIRDMHRKRRGSPPPHFYGESHPLSKNTANQVREAVAQVSSGEHQRVVARRFGVSQCTIWRWFHGQIRSRDSGVSGRSR